MNMSDQETALQKLEMMMEIQKSMAESLGSSVFPSEQVALAEWKVCVSQLRREEFCFTVDLSSMGFPLESNTDTFFGKKLLNVPYFLGRIHPEFLEAYLRWGAAAYSLSLNPEHKTIISGRRVMYRILIPLLFQPFPEKENKACYYWVMQTARPFRLDEQNLMTEQLNLYRILKKYESGDLATFKAEVCYEDGLVTEEETRSLMKHLNQNLLIELGEEASDILNCYSEGANTSEEVAEYLSISVNRVRTVQKGVLKYANQWYPWKKFTMAKQFAQFMQEEIILND